MLDLVNSFADRFPAVPVIDASRWHGPFEVLAGGAELSTKQLVIATKANEGYLHLALQLLLELGWAEQSKENIYRLTQVAQMAIQIPADIDELLQISVSGALQDPAGELVQR